MSVESKAGADASIGELMGRLSAQTSRLVRDEMRVESIKADIKEVK